MAPTPRERLITGAIAMVRERGVAGTGISDLLVRSNTARRSIYQNFPGGKAELIEQSTRAAGAFMSAVIADFSASDDPVAALGAFVDMWKSTLVDSDFTAGCPIVAAALGGVEVPSAPAAASEVFEDWFGILAAQLERSGVGHDVARSLAVTVVSAVEGAAVLCMASRTAQPLDQVRGHLTALIGAQLPHRAQ